MLLRIPPRSGRIITKKAIQCGVFSEGESSAGHQNFCSRVIRQSRMVLVSSSSQRGPPEAVLRLAPVPPVCHRCPCAIKDDNEKREEKIISIQLFRVVISSLLDTVGFAGTFLWQYKCCWYQYRIRFWNGNVILFHWNLKILASQ